MAIFPLSGRVESCKVSLEVWLSTLGQTFRLSWEVSNVFKMKEDDDQNEHALDVQLAIE